MLSKAYKSTLLETKTLVNKASVDFKGKWSILSPFFHWDSSLIALEWLDRETAAAVCSNWCKRGGEMERCIERDTLSLSLKSSVN